MLKYVSIEEVKNSIETLKKYQSEHNPTGDLYEALGIAVYVMEGVLENTLEGLMAQRGGRFDS
jgi:hypothetical protein